MLLRHIFVSELRARPQLHTESSEYKSALYNIVHLNNILRWFGILLKISSYSNSMDWSNTNVLEQISNKNCVGHFNPPLFIELRY